MWIGLISLFITIQIFRLFRKDEYGNNYFSKLKKYPPISKEKEEETKAYCRKLIEKDINSFAGECFPEIKEEIKAINDYNKLVEEYNSGNIDYIEFQLQSSKLVSKITIEDINK